MSTRVAVLAHHDVNPFHLSVPGLVFGELATASGIQDWEVVHCAVRPGPVRTVDGYEIVVSHGLAELAAADMVIVPSCADPHEDPPPVLLEALRTAHARGALVAGLCLGAFTVAAAGVLDGRRATTHWRAAGVFAQRFPAVVLEPTVLYVDEGDVITSAGTAASLDACLHIVRRTLGSFVADQVARGLVVSPQREGRQAQFVDRPLPDPSLGDVLDWARARLGERLDVETMATRACMSRRTFSRAFVRLTGETPARWVRSQRLREAQRLLETTDLSVERIAGMCGFGGAVTLRQNFAAEYGLTPLMHRKAFARRRPA